MADEKGENAGGGLDKNKKYDRQLRLWGDHGQAALESAKICLINASATGTEILKNLILPGIGSFTIVDGHKIRGEDVGNNFFLDRDSIGKSRAHVATELLLELNGDVNGDLVDENPEELLDNNATFFTNFNIVIATDLQEKTLLKLGGTLWEAGIPLIVCRSYGMVGYMRLVVKEHPVVESHPDSSIEDLRLDHPIPGFQRYCDALDLQTMTMKEHSHTPWLVILYKSLLQWKAEHGGEGPKNYREKNLLKELIRQGIRRNDEGVPADEENFEEAILNVNTALVPTRIRSSVKEIFNDPSCIELHPESKAFWMMARAVKDFVENEGEGTLPVRGTIPDMTSDSSRYIRLQNIYREKAAQDAAIVTRRVHQILQNLGRPQDSITESDVSLFCKNAAFLRVVRCRSLEDEYNSQTAKVSDIAMHLEDPDNDDTVFYVLLRAVERFHSEYNRYPGYYDDHIEADIPKLKTCLCKILQEWGLGPAVKDDFVHEMCRYGASEPHSVAAFMGGACAQEVIKVVTEQFVPINNTFIYNAMKQTSISLEL